jgi:predicted ATPase
MEGSGPVLKHFKIIGLHGYKDVTLEFSGAARVIVAENGSGKTTVFNVLNAIISRRFQRLSSIIFEAVEIGFFGNLLPIVIRKEHLGNFSAQIFEQIGELARYGGVESAELIDFLQGTYERGAYAKYGRNSLVHRIYLNSPHGHEEIGAMLDGFYDALEGTSNEELKQAKALIAQAFSGIEIVYLPTYRRIELPLMRASKRKGLSSRQRLLRGDRGPVGLDAHNINFGLADVEEALAQLTEEIERRSNMEYRAISATILDEIIRDQVEKQAVSSQELPDIESLTRFLSRVTRDSAAGVSLDAIKRLYESGEIDRPDKLWLRYFLGRLNLVISGTRQTELKLERFVEVSNEYLSSSSDEKQLTYDPQTMKVVVKNSWTGTDIDLDDLSSGEKQVVSLMAKLYLSDAPKFVMIDEPELSLSMDWQRKILPDVLASGSVIQLLAITHSPFVFENDLDPVAGPMMVVRNKHL